jgi:type II secretory pathway component GspD/PulD (secretin)
MNKKLYQMAIAIVFGATLVGAPMKAMAQIDIGDKIIPSLEFSDADVRDALRALFKSVGANYNINSEVQGTVTVSLQNVPFDTALRNILSQVNATYKVEGGIYQIILKPTDKGPDTIDSSEVPTTTKKNLPQRIKIKSIDPATLFKLLNAEWDPFMEPETSTTRVSSNLGGGSGGGFGGGGFGGGGFGNSGGGFGSGGGGFGSGGGGFGSPSGGGGFGGGGGGFGGGRGG